MVEFIQEYTRCSLTDFHLPIFAGCTIGSTHVEQQLKELRDLGGGERSRPKQFYAYNNTKTRLEADQAVFKVYKGVKCFDFSKDKNIIVTGGQCGCHQAELLTVITRNAYFITCCL